MTLDWFSADHFRNLADARLHLSPGINLIYGENGSGKTSLLEACYFLSAGRSFRGNTVDPLIEHGQESFLLRGQVSHGADQHYQLGISRDRAGQRQIRLNGDDVKRASELATLLPSLVLGPHSVELLSGPPTLRRRFLNWGVFHVEPSFSESWKEANRCLNQRNQLLRLGEQRRTGNQSMTLATWTEQLVRHAETIHDQRTRYVSRLCESLDQVLPLLTALSEVSIDYYPGWDAEKQNLEDVYRSNLETDQKRGFTQRGFQRADVRIKVSGSPAAEVCSRGELKALSWALMLAQGRIQNQQSNGQVLYLVDDLASEFDAGHRGRVCEFLRSAGQQVLVTGVDRVSLEKACSGEVGRMFHVKQGKVEVQETEIR